MSTDHVELKQLAVRRDQVERRLKALREELSVLDQKMRTEQRDLGSIDAQMSRLKQKNKVIVISEHAILRYLERVKGVDIEATKREIMPPSAAKAAQALGPGEYQAGTHSIKVKDNVVVTILTKLEKPEKPKREREVPGGEPLIEIKKGSGTLKCLKCQDLTDRLLKGGLCVLCVQEGFSLE
jgi:hypothetical protein